jgi:hypothetical protein
MRAPEAPRRPLPVTGRARRRTRLHIWLPAALCLWATLPAMLAAEEPRMFRVEMVLVSHTDRNAIRSEVWQSGTVPRLEDAVEFGAPGLAESEPLFRDVSGTPFGLRGVVTRLEQSPLFDVIASYAWEQPGLPQEQALPVRIRGGQLLGHVAPAPEQPLSEPWRVMPVMERAPRAPQDLKLLYDVDGTVTLSLARFLHLQTDLLYRRATNEALPGNHVRTLEGREFVESYVGERRRMRSREIHYLDHPMLGVIVEITPLEN